CAIVNITPSIHHYPTLIHLDMYLFFFTRRRRHTRLVSDWSPDVCSSDLRAIVSARRRLQAHAAPATRYRLTGAAAIRAELKALRSEERRVGKEWRARWREEGDKRKE